MMQGSMLMRTRRFLLGMKILRSWVTLGEVDGIKAVDMVGWVGAGEGDKPWKFVEKIAGAVVAFDFAGAWYVAVVVGSPAEVAFFG